LPPRPCRKVIDIDDDANKIDSHWRTWQGIFAQSDQSDDRRSPNGLLDRIHVGVHEGNEDS
jgi:hypothetical protein